MRRLSIRAMPIYEYYSPDTNRIYPFYAKTLAQGQQIPVCPDNPKARMRKIVSSFAVTGRRQESPAAPAEFTAESSGGVDDARMGAAMSAMEREFSNADENDPRAMARMMRRMAELSGEKLDEPMEEAVRKLASDGMPIVIVNPTAPVGPRDVKPTPTGRTVLEAAAGRMPAFVDTGLNLAHVDDVAKGQDRKSTRLNSSH